MVNFKSDSTELAKPNRIEREINHRFPSLIKLKWEDRCSDHLSA